MQINSNIFLITKIKKKDLKSIFPIRNQSKIRKSMINRKTINFKDHLWWYENKIKKKELFYCFNFNKKIIGAAYTVNYNPKKKFCSWGIYISQEINSQFKLGSILKYLFYKKIFSLKNIKYLETQVVKGNEQVKAWYERWGAKYISYDKKNNCYNLILTKNKWEDNLLLIKKRIRSLKL